MTYQVVIQPRAEAEAEKAYRYIAEQSPSRAARWLSGLYARISTLAISPRRGSLAPESDACSEEVRQVLYGRGRGAYRIVFVIRAETVYILSIRHGARQPMRPAELLGDSDEVA
jgi:plasmid stabilization system protein ParE